MGDYEKKRKDYENAYWRKRREDMVKQVLIRQGKMPNFVMTNGEPLPEQELPEIPAPPVSGALKFAFGLVLLALIAAFWRFF